MAIFDRYNLSVIAKAIDLFYQQVLSTEELSSYFKKVNMVQLREHQIELLSYVMGGPETYRIDELKKAHQRLNIPNSHFDLAAAILQKSLSDASIEDRDVKTIMAVVETTRNLIVKGVDYS